VKFCFVSLSADRELSLVYISALTVAAVFAAAAAAAVMFIIRLEDRLQPNIEFTLGGVHAFSYNSTESEPICMKSGAL